MKTNINKWVVLIIFGLFLIPINMYLVPNVGAVETWINPDTMVNSAFWDNEDNAKDGNTETHALETSGLILDEWLEGQLDSSISCDKIQVYVSEEDRGTEYDASFCDIQVYYDSSWNTIVTDVTITKLTWVEYEIGSTEDVSKVQIRCNDGSRTFRVYGLQFNSITIENDIPIASNIVPVDNKLIYIYFEEGMSIQPIVNLSVYCSDNESAVTVYWLSDSSGSWVQFGINLSVENETIYQEFINFTVFNTWYYWSINVTDGTNWVNNTQRFKIIKGTAPISYGVGAGWVLCSMPVNSTISKFDVRLINATQNYSWQQAVDNGIVLSFVYNWSVSNQNYQEALSFVPYEGYWIYIYDLNYSLWVGTTDISSGSSSIGIVLLTFGLIIGVIIKKGHKQKPIFMSVKKGIKDK